MWVRGHTRTEGFNGETEVMTPEFCGRTVYVHVYEVVVAFTAMLYCFDQWIQPNQ